MAAWRIDVPEELVRPRLLQLPCAFAAGKKMLAGEKLFIDAHSRSQGPRRIGQFHNRRLRARSEPAHTKLWIIACEHASRRVAKADTQRIEGEMSSCNRGGEGDLAFVLPDRHRTRLPVLGDHRLGVITNGPPMWEESDAKQIGRERSHLDCCRPSTQANA